MLHLRIAVILFFVCFTSCKKTPAENGNNGFGTYIRQTFQYKTLPNTAANLLSLDVYSYADIAQPKPVVIYVHGGGWSIGDKTNKLDNKLALFSSLGYIFVSVNYRLSPAYADLSNPNRIKYPDHNNDVADAVKWVIDNVGRYGGNPAKMVLLGHSSGAHLVSLTGTSQFFLPARNIPLAYIKGVASIDTEGYDVTSQSSEEIYQNAFGTDYNLQVQASPIFSLTNAYTYPKFFIAKRGTPSRIALADAFINKLQAAGVNVSGVNGAGYDHEGINDAIGNPNDQVVTPALTAFLKNCFQ